LREVAVKVLAVQACSFFRNGRGARGGRRACISGGGGETLAGKRGSEASSAVVPHSSPKGLVTLTVIPCAHHCGGRGHFFLLKLRRHAIYFIKDSSSS